MKKTANPQPNFETLKRAFYQAYITSEYYSFSEKATSAILLAALSNKDFRPFHKKKEEFKVDFNKWLNGIDIRQAGELIDALVKENKSVPGWMAKKQYVIDYNEQGALDLIRVYSQANPYNYSFPTMQYTG